MIAIVDEMVRVDTLKYIIQGAEQFPPLHCTLLDFNKEGINSQIHQRYLYLILSSWSKVDKVRRIFREKIINVPRRVEQYLIVDRLVTGGGRVVENTSLLNLTLKQALCQKKASADRSCSLQHQLAPKNVNLSGFSSA